jgi:hypothetical protein
MHLSCLFLASCSSYVSPAHSGGAVTLFITANEICAIFEALKSGQRLTEHQEGSWSADEAVRVKTWATVASKRQEQCDKVPPRAERRAGLN